MNWTPTQGLPYTYKYLDAKIGQWSLCAYQHTTTGKAGWYVAFMNNRTVYDSAATLQDAQSAAIAAYNRLTNL